ncbi:MAG: hypothetical protein ACKOHH_01405 [Bacteroidota bacterium]
MKRFFCLGLLVACLYPMTGAASHFLSGYIGVVQTSNDSVRLQMSLYLDSAGIVAPTVQVEQWNLVGGMLQMNGNVLLYQANTTSYQGVRIVTYLSSTTAFPAGAYRFVYKHCCRNTLVLNMPSIAPAFQMVIGTDYTKTPASGPPSTHSNTPIFTSPVPFLLLEDTTQILAFRNYITEPDGDSVVVETDSVLIDHGGGPFVAATGATPLSAWGTYFLSPITLNVLWRPDSAGLYACGWLIKEFRNGQLIGRQRIQHHFKVQTYRPSSVLEIPNSASEAIWDPNSYADYYQLNGQLVHQGSWFDMPPFKGVLLIRQGRKFFKKAIY